MIIHPIITDHGVLTGLGDDDHSIYWADTTIGTRATNYATTGTLGSGVHTITKDTAVLISLVNSTDDGTEGQIIVGTGGITTMRSIDGDIGLRPKVGDDIRLLFGNATAGNLVTEYDGKGNLGAPAAGRLGSAWFVSNITAGVDITAGNNITAGVHITATTGSITASNGDIIADGSIYATTGDIIAEDAASTVQGATLTDGTLSINSGSITSGVNATFSGIITAGEFNTTDYSGTVNGTLAAIGVANTTPAATFVGLLEVVSDSTHKLPSTVNNAIAAQAYFDAATAYPSIIHSSILAQCFPSGTITALKGYNGLYGKIESTVVPGHAAGDASIYALQFEATHTEDWIWSGAGIGRAVLDIRGITIQTKAVGAAKEVSGTKAVLDMRGINNTVIIDGSYDATNAVDGVVYGEKILITDSLTDVGAGATLNSYGLHITVPTTGGKTGEFNSYAAVMGDGTNQVRILDDGDLVFEGTAGLLFGNMDQENATSFTVTLTNQNEWYELDHATTGITAGELNDVTFDGDHYLKGRTAGMYFIVYSLVCSINDTNQHIEFQILKNGSVTGKGESHTTFIASSRDLSCGSNTILDLAVDDEISIAARNVTVAGKIITIDHLEMSIFMVGGT